MSKIALIIEREYISRVKKRSFIVLTFLTPFLIVALTMVPLLLSQIKGDDVKQIAVIDHTGLYNNPFIDQDNYHFLSATTDIEAMKRDKSIYAVAVINQKLSDGGSPVSLFSEKQIPIQLKKDLERRLKEIARDERLSLSGIENIKEIIDQSYVSLNISSIKWSGEKEEEGSSGMALTVGMISTFIIYMFIFIYGAQVMQGVMQEKTNRIVEVMISSVKPFELMMGKIIGIALVGLTQVLLWGIFVGVILLWGSMAFNIDTMSNLATTQMQQTQMAVDYPEAATIIRALLNINLVEIVVMFIVYFIGGYLLYASMFAAVGAAVDNETDTQQFILPITIPIIFAIYAALYSAQNPDGPLAFWCSMVPFTSPIVMMIRLPYGVAAWELMLSVSLLTITFVGMTYLSGRIYRIGILMYGKKPSWREIAQWIMRSN